MRKAWEKVNLILRKIGHFQSKLLMLILYFTVFLPVNLYGTLLADHLDKKGRKGWVRRDISLNEEWLRRQF